MRRGDGRGRKEGAKCTRGKGKNVLEEGVRRGDEGGGRKELSVLVFLQGFLTTGFL